MNHPMRNQSPNCEGSSHTTDSATAATATTTMTTRRRRRRIQRQSQEEDKDDSESSSSSPSSKKPRESQNDRHHHDHHILLSDSEEDDELLRTYAGQSVFSKKKKPNTTTTTKPSKMSKNNNSLKTTMTTSSYVTPEGTPPEEEDDDEQEEQNEEEKRHTKVGSTTTAGPSSSSPPWMGWTKDEIEAKAQKMIQDMTYPSVEKIDDLNALVWRRQFIGKKQFQQQQRRRKRSRSHRHGGGAGPSSSSTTTTQQPSQTQQQQPQRKYFYYPCVIIPNDEAQLIFEDPIPSKKVPINYLGKFWRDATKRDLVIQTTLFKFFATTAEATTEEATGHSTRTTTTRNLKANGDDEDENDNEDDDDSGNEDNRYGLLEEEGLRTDEDILTLFLEQEFPNPEDVIHRLAEELVFFKTVEIVRQNQMTKHLRIQQQKEEEINLNSQHMSEEISGTTTTTGPLSPNSRGRQSQTCTTAPRVSSDSPGCDKKTNKERNDPTQDDSSSADEDISVGMPFSPESKRKMDKRIILRPGDIIEYYETNRVFGRADARRISKIVGVDPRGVFPINLESGDCIQMEDRIRRIQKIYKGKIIPDPNPTFRCVSSYGLRAAGTMKNIAAQAFAQKAQQLRTEYDSTIDQHWAHSSEQQHDDDKGNSAMEDEEDQNGQTRDSKQGDHDNGPITPSARKLTFESSKGHSLESSSSSSTTTTTVRQWHRDLTRLIVVEEEKMKTKRRYISHVTPDELRLILMAWSILENRINMADNNGNKKKNNKNNDSDNRKKKKVLSFEEHASRILVEELEIPERRAQAILKGDPAKSLSQESKKETLQALESWIVQCQSSGISS